MIESSWRNCGREEREKGGELPSSRRRAPGDETRRAAHLLEVVDRDLVAEEVEEGVLEGARVAVREDEAVTVDPLGVLRVALEEARCGNCVVGVSATTRQTHPVACRRRASACTGEQSGPKVKERGETHRRGRGRPGPCPWAHPGDPSWPGFIIREGRREEGGRGGKRLRDDGANRDERRVRREGGEMRRWVSD